MDEHRLGFQNVVIGHINRVAASMYPARQRFLKLLFLLSERQEEPLLATAQFFDLATVHGQGQIN